MDAATTMNQTPVTQQDPQPAPALIPSRRRQDRVRWEKVSDSDRTYTILMHLSPLLGFVVPPVSVVLLVLAPLALWLIRRNDSPFIDDHGRDLVNFVLSLAIYSLVLTVTVVGPFVVGIIGIVNFIRAAVAAKHDELFRFPVTIRFLS